MSNTSTVETIAKNETSVVKDEVEKFQSISETWWENSGEMYVLKLMNKVRVPFIKKGIINDGNALDQYKDSDKPLKGLKILDAGCGGGFLSEAIARLGATVIALDASEDLINIAENHKQLDINIINNLTYLYTTIEEFCINHQEYFDVVIMSEVIEHIIEKESFIKHCVSCLRPGGSTFVTTINQNMISKVGVFMSEYVFNILPRGTHEYDKLLTPKKLRSIYKDNKCTTKKVQGATCNPFTCKWYWAPITVGNYFLHATKDIEC